MDLDVVLEPLEHAGVTGRIVDVNLNPIPHFSLWLRSTAAAMQPALQVTGDDYGNFTVPAVPEGNLVFETRSFPLLAVSHTLPPSAVQEEVDVIIDWGVYGLQGQVTDSAGKPVSLPRLTLSWSHRKNGVRSRSVRKIAGDADGYFAFTQLGPGRHTLSVDAPGFPNRAACPWKSAWIALRSQCNWKKHNRRALWAR